MKASPGKDKLFPVGGVPSIRELLEEREERDLHPRAAKSRYSRGRMKEEPPCPVRTAYQRDRDRIIHSKAFRRLKHKTQVFLAPEGDHYRTRLTHTLEVAQVARTIARALGLNEDLTEAIALGHDLGHTPFGHAGEAVLKEIHPGGFSHPRQSLRVVDILEKGGKGLNLTYEVREGILKHSKGMGSILPGEGEEAVTLEGQVVRLSDGIAYVNHDLDDALRAGIITLDQVPSRCLAVLGETHSARINTLVVDVIRASMEVELERIVFSPLILDVVMELRDFLYEKVYSNPLVYGEFVKASKVVRELYYYFLDHPQDLPPFPGEDVAQKVCDFIAGMTDRYALNLYTEIFMPHPWEGF